MLNENIKTQRKAKGLSQEELAERLNVVRQTVSKWEQGLSVPDAEMLISISQCLDTPVSTLLGENIEEQKYNETEILSEKLEAINFQLAGMKEARRKRLNIFFISAFAAVILIWTVIFLWGSQYLEWDFGDPEVAVAGTILHAFEFVFVRIAPFLMAGTIVGAVLTRKKSRTYEK